MQAALLKNFSAMERLNTRKATIYLLNDESANETPEMGDMRTKAWCLIFGHIVSSRETKGKSRVLTMAE